jgi:hypothetical protein
VIFIKVNDRLKLTRPAVRLNLARKQGLPSNLRDLKPAGIIMSRVTAALLATTIVAALIPAAASAGCYSCYAPPPPPCGTCYQQQVVPPQYRTVQETVMVSPGRVIAHRTPAQYQTVMVPRTVMVAPEGVQYEQLPPQYATQEHVEMVAPARVYYAPVAPRCGTCGY